MAVLGRLLLGSAERVDLPDMLSIDSYAAGDWKFFLKGLVGDDKPFILKGFDIIDPQNAIGTQNCSIRVADSMVFYPGSTSGSFFHGLPEGNVNAAPLVPELRKNATNFVYLTFSTFNTSVDTRAFWDPDKDGAAGGEFTQDVNTESVLRVDVNVSTGSFPENTIPIAKIVVGAVVITSITDCRDLLFRLGTGGISPDPFSNYQFRSLPDSTYKRSEPPITMSAGGANPFEGGDKNIYTLKEWMDLVMTKFKELSGTTYWYEDLSSYSLISGFIDALATTFKSKGKWQHSSATPGLLTWTEDLVIKVTSDPRDTIIRAGSVQLANEQVAYIPLIRNQPINGSDSPVSWTNGQPYVNTVGGATGFFANLAKGDWIKKVNDPNHLFLRVEEFYDSVNLGGSTTTAANARSIRLNANYQGSTLIEKARYDKGVYLSTDVLVANRNSAALTTAGGNFHWIATRSDVIENIASVSTASLSGTLSETDGQTAKVVSTAHGLQDGDQITVSTPVAQAGTYIVEVEDANTFYINTTNMSTGAFAATYALITTAARDNGYGLQLESANHEFETGDTVFVQATTNYNGSYPVSVRSATQIEVPIAATHATETSGTVTLARINVRAEQGLLKVVQGEDVQIGDGVSENMKKFIGMTSNADVHPLYSITPGYNTLDGMQNYNSLSTDNLTARVSKLTAMMADKAQDKTVQFLGSASLTTVTNTTNGAAQEITFSGSGSTLSIVTPGSNGTATVALPDTAPGISLLVNQVAYVVIDRNVPSTPTIQIANITEMPISENVFVIATRLSTTDIWIWEGSIFSSGAAPIPGFIETVVRQNQMMKLVEGGTWSWNLGTQTLTWTASAFMQLPGLANSVNSIAAGSIVLTAGQVAYVDINRVGPGGALTVVAAANATLGLSTDRIIIARRETTDVIVGNHSMRLVDGASKKLYAGASDQTLSYIGQPNEGDATPDYAAAVAHTTRFITEGSSLTTGVSSLDNQLSKLFGQLQLRAKDPNSSRVVITGADQVLLDNTTISQQLKNIILNFDGAEIDFETGDVYESDGVTSLGFNFTPATIASSQYRWYSITLIPSTVSLDNRISAKVQVIAGTSDGATADAAPRAQFATGGLKLGQVYVQNAGSPGVIEDIAQANVVQLGSGSGSGSDVEAGNVFEEHVDVVASPTGNNEMAPIVGSGAVTLPKDTNKLIGTSVIASTDGSTAVVSILKLNHGLSNGDLVTVTTATAIGGISAADLTVVDSVVTVVDANTFTYVADAVSTSVETGYLDRVTATTTRYYNVGDGSLEIYLNGIFQHRGDDWDEIGAQGTQSNAVMFNIDLVVGDLVSYRIDANIGQQIINSSGGGGSGEVNTASNLGSGAQLFKQKILADLQFRSIEAVSGVKVVQATNTVQISASLNTVVKTADYVALLTNDLILVSASATPVTITLPPVATAAGKTYYIKKVDATANLMTIAADGAETIDGISTKTSAVQYESFTIVCDGSTWWII